MQRYKKTEQIPLPQHEKKRKEKLQWREQI